MQGLRGVGILPTFLYASVYYGYSQELVDLIKKEVIPALGAPPQFYLWQPDAPSTPAFDPETLAPNGIRARLQSLETTIEMVHKKDGRTEKFNQDKFWRSIWRPLHKVPGALEHTGKIVAEFQTWVRSRREISSNEIGGFLLTQLWAVDTLAYLRFAIVHLRQKPTELRQAFLSALPAIEARAAKQPTDETYLLQWQDSRLIDLASAQLSNTLRDSLGVKVCYTHIKPLPAANFLGVLVFSPLTMAKGRGVRPPAVPNYIWQDSHCWSSCLSQHRAVVFLRELSDTLNQAGQCEYCWSSLTSKGVTSPARALAYEILDLTWRAVTHMAKIDARTSENVNALSSSTPGRIFWLSLPCPRGLQDLLIIP